MQKKGLILQNEKVWLILCVLLSFIVHVVAVNQLNGWFCTDTDGYWLHAATFTGHDWSGAASTANYFYSWGYSVILTIPFLISEDIHVMSQIAVVLNALFCGLTVPMFYDMGKKLFSDVSKRFLMVAATITSLYSSYFLLSTVALAECFIFFLYVLLLWLVLKLLDTEKTVWAVLSGVCCGYLYCTHHRTLGVIVAYVLLVVVLLFKNRKWKQNLCMVVPLVVVLCVDVMINDWLALHETAEVVYTSNTYSAMGGKLFAIFSFKGILYFIQSFLGQIWYIFAGTFLVGGLGLIYAIKTISHKVYENRFELLKIKNKYLFWGYMLLNVFLMLGVSCVGITRFSNDIHRNDVVFYGRYFEFTIPVLLFVGLAALYKIQQDNKIKRDIEVACLFMLLLSVLTHYFVQEISGNGLNYFSVAAVLFPYSYPNVPFTIIGTSICVISVALVVFYLCMRNEVGYRGVAYALIACGFLYTGYNTVINVREIYVQDGNMINYPSYNADFVAIDEFITVNQIDEFYVYTEDGYVGMSFQLYHPNDKILSINSKEGALEQIYPYIILPKNRLHDWSNVQVIMETENYTVCKFIQ